MFGIAGYFPSSQRVICIGHVGLSINFAGSAIKVHHSWKKVQKMRPKIDAIFIDLGNTLRILTKDEHHQSAARQKIAQLVSSSLSPETLCEMIDERYKVYRKWAFQTRIEAAENELWTRWLLPEHPPKKVAPIATELTYQYRQTMGRRVLVSDAREVITELDRRGYKLGIISNVISSREIPDWLEEDGLGNYFKSVVLSSQFGHRKPDPEIYWEAAKRINMSPGRCAYVGDNPGRDVVGTREAGFGMVIILMARAELEKDPPSGENRPDVIIHEFRQLLDLFPAG
jgi:putative hydrolase of the HAD superfamily